MELKIEQLQLDNAALLQGTKRPLPLSDERSGYIYIIRTKHASDMHVPIYKIGFTKNIFQRVRQYPKGAKLMFAQMYSDAREKEYRLHQFLHSLQCKQQHNIVSRSDYGSEYYESDLQNLINTVHEVLK